MLEGTGSGRGVLGGVVPAPLSVGRRRDRRAGRQCVFRSAAPALLAVFAAACGAVEAPAGDGGPDAAAGSQAAPVETAAPEAGASPRRPPAVPPALSSPEHERYQQLRMETLRLMIAAAKLALPIGPFQQRIDAASLIALDDVAEASARMEGIVADLRQAVGDAAP